MLQLISDKSTPLPQSESVTTTLYFATGLPSDVHTLQFANKAFNEALTNSAVATPLQACGRNLSRIAEYLYADNTILRQKNDNLKRVIGKRKEWLSTKRLIMKGKDILSTENIQSKLAVVER